MQGPLKLPKKGRFRIQSVAEMTGVPASTLRAWEQRYGFPAPERTASAYRVYSQSDIDLIASVRAKCDAGMAPAEAVAEVLDDGDPATPPEAPRAIVPAPTLAPNATIVDRLVAAAHASQPSAVDDAIRSAMMLGSPLAAFDSALAPTWARLRAQWVVGEIDSGRIRIAMEVLGHAARDLIRLGQPNANNGHAVLSALPDEDDIIPLVRAAFDAQAQGLRAVVIAPRASAQTIGLAAQQLSAARVAISCSEAPPPRRARELFDDIASRVGSTPWTVCGPAREAVRAVVEQCGGTIAEY